MNETWRRIPGFLDYAASSLGQIKRIRPGRNRFATSAVVGKILAPAPNGQGYLHVSLAVEGRRHTVTVHRAVMLAFAPLRPPKYEINHRDGNKNNNAFSNLEYLSCQENHAHAAHLGLKAHGERVASSKLTNAEVVELKQLSTSGVTSPVLAKRLGVSRGHVNSIKRGQYRSRA